MSEETFDARMERLLLTLPPALRGMGFGDPDDAEYAHASDVVAWAIKEIARLREERDTLLESQLWGVNCKPTPPEAAETELPTE